MNPGHDPKVQTMQHMVVLWNDIEEQKPKERSSDGRFYAVALTKLEELMAWWNTYILEGHRLKEEQP